jgi:hypothetical protein
MDIAQQYNNLLKAIRIAPPGQRQQLIQQAHTWYKKYYNILKASPPPKLGVDQPNVAVESPTVRTKKRQRIGDVTGMESATRAAQTRLDQILGSIAGMGGAERLRIDRDADRSLAFAKQHMINRGLGASTVLSSLERRAQEQKNMSHMALSDRLRAATAGVLERVNDQPLPLTTLMDTVYRRARS